VTRRAGVIARVRAIAEDPRAPQGEREAARALLARLLAREQHTPGTAAYWREFRRWVGDKYEQTRDIPLTEVAKLIRREIAFARKMGRKPAKPGDIKVPEPIGDAPPSIRFSVRTRKFSGGAAIDVIVGGIPEDWGWTVEDDGWGSQRQVPSPALKELAAELRRVVNAYNYDGSDPTVDLYYKRFYGSVSTEEGTYLA